MAGNSKLDLNGIFRSDAERKRQKSRDQKELTFRDYIELVRDDPLIAQNAPSRLLEAILALGTETIPENERMFFVDGEPVTERYRAFASKLFGVDAAIFQAIKYLKTGASHLSTGKQILLFIGPTGSGKSTFVNCWKSLLENYNLRPVFAIKDCPIHEEPLHLIPRYMRDDVARKPEDCPAYPNCKSTHLHLGVKIRGDLCPKCRYKLETEFKNGDGTIRWWDVPVETLTFSIQGARGIGSFEPSDPKSQDVSELVGRENIAISATKGPEHPDAWSLSGELEKANRGLCECRELIKADEKILWVFISVAEEQELKVQGSNFPHISIDTVVVGHTNLTEYKKFAANQSNEALHDRIYVIHFPYPLRIRDEVKIYRKLIEQEADFGRLARIHIAPGSLELAATFAILTRLVDTTAKLDLLLKAKIYNGDVALTEIEDKDKKPIDIRSLIEEGQSSPDIAKREGMFGVSSRDVLAAINIALAKQTDGCLTPLTVIRALREVFEHRIGYSPEEIQRFRDLLSAGEGGSVMAEYKDFVVKAVSRAFLRTYSDLAREIFRRYVEEVQFYRAQNRAIIRGSADVKRDELSGKPKEPDIKFLRSVEEHMGISESQAHVFRGEILEVKAGMENFNYDTYSPLARAVDKKLLADSRASLTLVLATDKPKGDEEKKRLNDIFQGLTDAGFCKICAREFVEKAQEFLNE